MSRRLSRLLDQKYFLCAPSTTSLLVTIIGASIYHNYIFSCFVLFVCFVFISSCFLLLRKSVETGAREMYRKWRRRVLHLVKVVPKVWCLAGITTLLLLLLHLKTATDFFSPIGARGLCNCVTAFRVLSTAAGFSRPQMSRRLWIQHHKAQFHSCLSFDCFV